MTDRLRPHWDFDDLDATERRLRAALAEEASEEGRAEVLTQLASRGMPLDRALTATFDDLLAYEARLQQEAGETDDHRAAVEAFLKKQPASFSGT